MRHRRAEVIALRFAATFGDQKLHLRRDFGAFVAFEQDCALQFSINTFNFLVWRYF